MSRMWLSRLRLRWFALLLTVGLAAAACGVDRDGGALPGESTGPDVSAADVADTEPPSDVKFGDLPSPCGGGNAAAATAQGVSADSITIGYGDDAGYSQAPGLNHQQADAMEAMIEWCNAQGGINGREIKGNYYDAKILEVNNVMLSACSEVFMLVGEGWALDSAQEETRVGCGLGAVAAWAVSPEFSHGPFMVTPLPNPTDYWPLQNATVLAAAFPEQVKRTALVYANFAATIDTKDKVVATYPSVGFEFLPCDQPYNISGEDDWKPFVQNLKDCEAEVVYFAGSPNPNFQNFLSSAAQLDYHPIYITETNFYEEGFAEWNAQNGGIADDVYFRMAFAPLSEAPINPAVQQFLDIVQGNGGDVSQLGMQATSAFLLWATAVKACGDNVTRDCVFTEIAKITQWTGGGLHAPTNPAAKLPPDCAMTLKLQGSEFVRFAPVEPGTYDCDPAYVVPVTGEVVDRVALNGDRVSTRYLK
jgi:ABC-type branched-subunit amino acid transport system substrate-binding protein